MKTKYVERLKELHKITKQTPLFNPVFQLSLELSRELENGTINLDEISNCVRELECEALQTRAKKLQKLLGPVDNNDNISKFRNIVEKSAKENDFEAFSKYWSRPLLHCVFTAHPTFLLNREEYDSVARAASQGEVDKEVCIFAANNDNITLDYEHQEVLQVSQLGADARNDMTQIILEIGEKYFPNDWLKLRPRPFRFASWVGYDMDGRTDISWSTSIRYRLLEKAEKLGRYSRASGKIGLGEISQKLENAQKYTIQMADIFAKDLSSPQALSNAANLMTAHNEDKILTLTPIIDEIGELAKSKDSKTAREYIALASNMLADGLGIGQIHFRLNSAQLNNAIRRHLGGEQIGELSSKTALSRLGKLLKNVKPLRSNFAALAIESTTALRQFLAIAQMLNHIDSDTPIRLLIAECEQPQTVLIALYFAKLFGVDQKVDISPLFETETAMEHGARFLDALMGDKYYREYVRSRGIIAIQTGFSDAGRFLGQIPASLAIERLHGRMARIMAKHNLDDVAALIFNTHGESMGRGAHPHSMHDRLNYNMSEWAREQFSSRNIGTFLEVSFQGGDGYLFFRNYELALATLTRIAEVEIQKPEWQEDPFYSRTDLSLDFYRGIRRIQRDYLNNPAYSRAITAFGLGFLKQTGSRKSRRQSDLTADRDMSLRQIRAIPHNAVLQQLGYPVNIIAGAGTASKDDIESLANLLQTSRRGSQLLRLLQAANSIASIKSLAAYGELFNCAYWASRPYRGTESQLEGACLALAEQLEYDDRPSVFRRLASSLRVDGLRFHQLLKHIELQERDESRENVRRSLGVLHALRLCLMQHIFLRAVQIPQFSRRNDISRDDVLEMIFSLRIEEALNLLHGSFPIAAPSLKDFSIDEPTDYPKDNEKAYEELHTDYFDKIDKAQKLMIRIGVSIANHFGAHG